MYNQRIIYAASIRATVLETAILNFELDHTITHRFKKENLLDCIKAVYIGFITIAVAIGVTVIFVASSTPINTLIKFDISSSTSILVNILKIVFLLILLLVPSIIRKINNTYKMPHFIWNTSEPIKLMFKIMSIAMYCIITLLSFYLILQSMFSIEITLSILLILIGCAGIYIITDFWNKLFIKTNTSLKKNTYSKKKSKDNPKKICYFKSYDDWIKSGRDKSYSEILNNREVNSNNKDYFKRLWIKSTEDKSYDLILDDWGVNSNNAIYLERLDYRMKSTVYKPYTGLLDYETVDNIFKRFDYWMKSTVYKPYTGLLDYETVDNIFKILDYWMKSTDRKPYTGFLNYQTVADVFKSCDDGIKSTRYNSYAEILDNWIVNSNDKNCFKRLWIKSTGDKSYDVILDNWGVNSNNKISNNKTYFKRLDDWMKSTENKRCTGSLDYWTLDRICCEQGEVVKITLTNFGQEDITINWGEEVCEIRSEDGNFYEILYAERNITIPPECNHSWLWDTSKATKDGTFPTEGIYRVKPIKPRTWDNPLKRSVIIHCYCKIKT